MPLRRLKKDLEDFLEGLGDTARVFDPDLYPGVAAEMRLGRSTFHAIHFALCSKLSRWRLPFLTRAAT